VTSKLHGLSLWAQMNARQRLRCADVVQTHLPTAPGVYAFYRDNQPVYVGKAADLRSRLWHNHLRRSASMRNSAFRRNVAHEFGIATAADIKALRYATTAEDAARVTEWICGCEVAWIECESETDAAALETAMKLELKPRLTKI
jgi:hypothetical protein